MDDPDFIASQIHPSVLQLFKIGRHMSFGIEVKDRTKHLKAHRQCFLGSEAAAWMAKRSDLTFCYTLNDCVALGELFRHCSRNYGTV